MALGLYALALLRSGAPVGWGDTAAKETTDRSRRAASRRRDVRVTPQSMAPIGPLGHTDAVLDGRPLGARIHLDNRRDRGLNCLAGGRYGRAFELAEPGAGPKPRPHAVPAVSTSRRPDTRNRLCNHLAARLHHFGAGAAGDPARFAGRIPRGGKQRGRNWERNPRHRFTRCDP